MRVVVYPSAPNLTSYDLFQPVLSGETSYKVRIFEGLQMSSYTLRLRRKLFQDLEAEAQQTPIMSPEVIRIAKG